MDRPAGRSRAKAAEAAKSGQAPQQTPAPKRLTDYSSRRLREQARGGRASRVLGGLPVPHDPRVLVDYRTADDAGV